MPDPDQGKRMKTREDKFCEILPSSTATDCEHRAERGVNGQKQGEGLGMERLVAGEEAEGQRRTAGSAPGHYGFAQTINADVAVHY